MSDIFMALTIHTYQKIYKDAKHPDNALILYMFYYKNAKYQDTNQPWSTRSYCMKGLGWGETKFKCAKRDLINLGLIQRVPAYGQKAKEFVKLNFLATSETIANVFVQDDKVLGGGNDGGQQKRPQVLKESKDKCLKSTSKLSSKEERQTSTKSARVQKIKKVKKGILKPNLASKPKKKNKKQKNPGYKYTSEDRKYYRLLKEEHNGRDHDKTKNEYIKTMDKIHSLFNHGCKNPYVVNYKDVRKIPDNKQSLFQELSEDTLLKDKKWMFQEFAELFDFYREQIGDGKNKSVGDFILSFNPKNNNYFSPLVKAYYEFQKTKEPTSKMGKKIHNKLRYMYPAKNGNTPIYVYENAGKALEDIMTDHSINTNSGYTSLLPFFIAYVKDKARSSTFLMRYIGKDFLIEFRKDAKKKNIIKAKGKKGMYDEQW